MTERPKWIAVGRVTRAHGLKGEVAVLPLSQVGSRYERGSRIFAGEDESNPLVVKYSRPHRSRILVAFENIGDRGAAEALRGQYLFVPATEAPSLPHGEFWTHELIGCRVVTESGRVLGQVKEVIRTPANDVWSVWGDTGEILVPALKDVVHEVDLEARRVVVREVPGLTVP